MAIAGGNPLAGHFVLQRFEAPPGVALAAVDEADRFLLRHRSRGHWPRAVADRLVDEICPVAGGPGRPLETDRVEWSGAVFDIAVQIGGRGWGVRRLGSRGGGG